MRDQRPTLDRTGARVTPQRAVRVLALRLLALGVVAGSAAFLPSVQLSPVKAVLAILLGAALGGVQYLCVVHGHLKLVAAIVPPVIPAVE